MSKLEVIQVKVKGKDASVNDFLYSVRRDLDHMTLRDILGLDVVHVESQIIDDKHVTIINYVYQITTDLNKIFCPINLINLEDDDYIELKFDNKTFKVYRHFSYIGVTKSKTRDMLAERIYLIRKEMTQIRKMMPELEIEVTVEVTVNGEPKKINTLVSKEEAQNIIDQIFSEKKNDIKQEIVEIRWDGEEVSLEEFLSKLDEKKASRIKELLNEDIVSISEGARLPDYTIPLFIEVAESKRQYVLMQTGASRGQIVLCFNDKYYTITDMMNIEKTVVHLTK